MQADIIIYTSVSDRITGYTGKGFASRELNRHECAAVTINVAPLLLKASAACSAYRQVRQGMLHTHTCLRSPLAQGGWKRTCSAVRMRRRRS